MEKEYIVEIICPLYNSKNKIISLIDGLKKQKKIEISKLKFVITDTNDDVESLLNDKNIEWIKILKEEFNHAQTRENALNLVNTKYAVMITDDVVFFDVYAIYNLIKFAEENFTSFTFGRQICTNKTIEKYTRLENYPSYSYINQKKEIEKKQIKAFFGSDSFALYDINIFKKIKGYDSKILPTNEDMYYCRKLLLNGYLTGYCSTAKVEHSHNFSLKQVYERYFLLGRFLKENSEFREYKTNSSGLKLATKSIKYIIKDLNLIAFIKFGPNMIARYLGKRNGEKK